MASHFPVSPTFASRLYSYKSPEPRGAGESPCGPNSPSSVNAPSALTARKTLSSVAADPEDKLECARRQSSEPGKSPVRHLQQSQALVPTASVARTGALGAVAESIGMLERCDLVSPYLRLRSCQNGSAAMPFLRRDVETFHTVEDALLETGVPTSYMIKGKSHPSGLVIDGKRIHCSHALDPITGNTFSVSDTWVSGTFGKIRHVYNHATNQFFVWKVLALSGSQVSNIAPDHTVSKEVRIRRKMDARALAADPRPVLGPRLESPLGMIANEVAVQNRFDHAGKVTDVRYFNGKVYLETPFVACADMFCMFEDNDMGRQLGPVGVAVINTLFKRMVHALAAFHRDTGHVYYDMKPENILFDLNGELHLTDFGLSKPLAEANTLAGTAGYFAPELWVLDAHHDQSIDFYGAALLYIEHLAATAAAAGLVASAVPQEYFEQFSQRDNRARPDVVRRWYADFAAWYKACVKLGPADGTVTLDFGAAAAAAPNLRRFTTLFRPLSQVCPAMVQFALRMLAPDPKQRPSGAECCAFVDGAIPDDPKVWETWQAYVRASPQAHEQMAIQAMLKHQAAL